MRRNARRRPPQLHTNPFVDAVLHAPQEMRSDDQLSPADDDMRPAEERVRCPVKSRRSETGPSSESAAGAANNHCLDEFPRCVGA